MRLLVSIHDVAPATLPDVEVLWALCEKAGVVPALLVVPNWHGCWPIERHAAFLEWLHRRVDAGAEVLLHGERHDESETGRTGWDSIRAFGRTEFEAEFLSLSYSAARAKIDRGLATLRRAGFDPVGFTAPAWLFRKDTERAVGDAGLRVSEDASSIFIHPAQRRVRSPALRWSARTQSRAFASAGVAHAAQVLYRGSALLRIALHPGDVTHWASYLSVQAALGHWTARRTVTTYAAL